MCCQSCRGCWSEIKVSAGRACSPEACRGRMTCLASPSLWGPKWSSACGSITPVSHGTLLMSHQAVFTQGMPLSPTASPIPTFYGHQSAWVRAHPKDIIVTWWFLSIPHFQIRKYSKGLGVRTSMLSFLEDTTQPIMNRINIRSDIIEENQWKKR